MDIYVKASVRNIKIQLKLEIFNQITSHKTMKQIKDNYLCESKHEKKVGLGLIRMNSRIDRLLKHIRQT